MFRLKLISLICLSLVLRAGFPMAVENPSDGDVSDAASSSFAERGLQSVRIQYGGKDALLVSDTKCAFYVVPMAAEGWHQTALRESVSEDERVIFFYRGIAYYDSQPRWYPIANSYLGRAGRYIGIDTLYRPVLGIIYSAICEDNVAALAEVDPLVRFKATYILDVLR